MKKIHPKMKALEWSQYFFHYKFIGIFSDAERAADSSVSGRILLNFDPIRDLWLFLLLTRKKNQSKMKELELSQDFPHFKTMRAICCHGNQSYDLKLAPNLMQSIPTTMMLQMKLNIDSEIFMFESVNGPTHRQMDASSSSIL